jgi:glycosyltransferase involved in cell wall biosynthesis
MTASTGRTSAGRIGRRVLIIVENLPVPFDRRVWNEANALRDAGYEVSIVCPKGAGAQESTLVLDGIRIYRHPLPLDARGALGYLLEYSSALFWETLLTWRVFLTHGFDAIHACNPPDLIFLIGGFFKYVFGKKFLFDHHDINPELYEAKFKRKDFFHRCLLAVERATFATADISIATNNSYREIAIARGKMPPDRVFVVRSGPSLERMRILPPEPALKKGRQYLVGYVGVMGAQEGIQYLLEAARHIIRDLGRTDIQFGLVGGGPELEHLKALAAELGIADYVTFTGRAPDADMLAMLNTADVCVNPDEYNAMNDKSTMNKIVEYMALGKPIVQFDLTEGRYSAGDASLYAANNDARDMARCILTLIDNPELCRRMGEIGRRRVVEELSWAHETPKLLEAYDALFAGRTVAQARLPAGPTAGGAERADVGH